MICCSIREYWQQETTWQWHKDVQYTNIHLGDPKDDRNGRTTFRDERLAIDDDMFNAKCISNAIRFDLAYNTLKWNGIEYDSVTSYCRYYVPIKPCASNNNNAQPVQTWTSPPFDHLTFFKYFSFFLSFSFGRTKKNEQAILSVPNSQVITGRRHLGPNDAMLPTWFCHPFTLFVAIQVQDRIRVFRSKGTSLWHSISPIRLSIVMSLILSNLHLHTISRHKYKKKVT